MTIVGFNCKFEKLFRFKCTIFIRVKKTSHESLLMLSCFHNNNERTKHGVRLYILLIPYHNCCLTKQEEYVSFLPITIIEPENEKTADTRNVAFPCYFCFQIYKYFYLLHFCQVQKEEHSWLFSIFYHEVGKGKRMDTIHPDITFDVFLRHCLDSPWEVIYTSMQSLLSDYPSNHRS